MDGCRVSICAPTVRDNWISLWELWDGMAMGRDKGREGGEVDDGMS